jgi:putative transposase
MPIHAKYLADFEEMGLYHVYNRTNNVELMFLNDQHRIYFLNRYANIVSPFVDTFAYSLLPNHFHLLIRVKTKQDIVAYLNHKTPVEQTISEKNFLAETIPLSELLELTFKRFFQSYAQAFNKDIKRKGNLFVKPFKRVLIKDEKHFFQTVIYIHANVVKHKILNDFTIYKWSSWNAILQAESSFLSCQEILEMFGGRKDFIEIHEAQAPKYFDYVSKMED